MKTPLHEIIAQAPDLVAATRDKYLRDLDQWITFAGADPKNWTRAQAQAFYQSLLDRGLQVQSANRIMWSVRYASKWWAHRENRPELDFGVVRRAKEHVEKTRRALSQEEATLLITACTGNDPLSIRDFAFVVISLETGMRKMSMSSMTWEHTAIGLYPTNLHNVPGYPVTQVLMKDHGNVRRNVPLSDIAVAALARWRVWSEVNGAKSGPVFRALRRSLGKRGQIVLKPSKTALGATAIQNLVATRGESAGIAHIHPHLFRHTFVTWRVDMGLEPIEIASITGHSLPSLGAMSTYIDMAVVGGNARTKSPLWLIDLVRSYI
jgi:integrase/recombinase XerD